jgi:hypothetical protein
MCVSSTSLNGPNQQLKILELSLAPPMLFLPPPPPQIAGITFGELVDEEAEVGMTT